MRTIGRLFLFATMASAVHGPPAQGAVVLVVCLVLWNPRRAIDAVIDWRDGVEVQRDRWDRLCVLVRGGR